MSEPGIFDFASMVQEDEVGAGVKPQANGVSAHEAPVVDPDDILELSANRAGSHQNGDAQTDQVTELPGHPVTLTARTSADMLNNPLKDETLEDFYNVHDTEANASRQPGAATAEPASQQNENKVRTPEEIQAINSANEARRKEEDGRFVTSKLTEVEAKLSALSIEPGREAVFNSIDASGAVDGSFSYKLKQDVSGKIYVELTGQGNLTSGMNFEKTAAPDGAAWQVVSKFDAQTGTNIAPDSNQTRLVLSLLDFSKLVFVPQTEQTATAAPIVEPVKADSAPRPVESGAQPDFEVIGKTPKARRARLLAVLSENGGINSVLAKAVETHPAYVHEFNLAFEATSAAEVEAKISKVLMAILTNEGATTFSSVSAEQRAPLVAKILETYANNEWQIPAKQGFLKKLRSAFVSAAGRTLAGILKHMQGWDVKSLVDGSLIVPDEVTPVPPVSSVVEPILVVTPLAEAAPQAAQPAEKPQTILDRILANQIKLESAKIKTDTPAIWQLDREIAADNAKLAEAQKQPDTEKSVETKDPAEKKTASWWNRWFPSKEKAPESVVQQANESGEMASSTRQAEIEAKLKAEHDAREEEKQLAKLDLEYVDSVIEGLIASGKAKGNRDVTTLILALAQHEIDTDGTMTLNESSEKRLSQLVEKAKIHPNALHAEERKFSHELQASAEVALERSALPAGKKDKLKRILGRTAVVTTAVVLAFALGGSQGGTPLLDFGGPAFEQACMYVDALQNSGFTNAEVLQQTLDGGRQMFQSWDQIIRLFGDPTTAATPDAVNQVVTLASDTAKGFIDRLAQDPGQAEAALEQVKAFFTPERVQAIAKVAQEFDINAGPQMLTERAVAANSREALQQITALVDSIATPEQRASAAEWIRKVTAVLKDFSVVPPAR